MNQDELKSYKTIYRHNRESNVKRWFIGILVTLIGFMLLPWTQNIKARGTITTLYQEDRPQEIHSPIPGRILKWWVKEGDYIKKGDTILQLSEIKSEYLDPNLVLRTQEQLTAKLDALSSYQNKLKTASTQIEALNEIRTLKLEQLKKKISQLNNKLAGERADQIAAINEFSLAKDQYERQQKMYAEGLVSQTQLQQRSVAFQNAQAKKQVVDNKIEQTLEELNITRLEQKSTLQEYNEKISKTEGERFQSQSQIAVTDGEVAKLANTLANYSIRNDMYIITAPQDGQIVQAKRSGYGEIVKEGERITMIVPMQNNFAVELFVRPVDLPLISIGQTVRFMFDGFPAIVFSGWPNNSYGTFGGKIIAYESSISPNGLFRVLVIEDPNERNWPQQLKMGSGAQGIALLKDVPIWYELWRNINGFPPDYYKLKEPNSKDKSNTTDEEK
jgi:multidrug resistance efflux pump